MYKKIDRKNGKEENAKLLRMTMLPNVEQTWNRSKKWRK